MTEITNRLKHLLQSGLDYLSEASEAEMGRKPSPGKWSKKEILGHLIDSGINNLQRFTEIQFEPKPYKIRKYNQDELVIANDYQNAGLKEITDFWISVNNRILNVIKQQTAETLGSKIEIDDLNVSDLRFLIQDYIDHLEHHLIQIMKTRG